MHHRSLASSLGLFLFECFMPQVVLGSRLGGMFAFRLQVFKAVVSGLVRYLVLMVSRTALVRSVVKMFQSFKAF